MRSGQAIKGLAAAVVLVLVSIAVVASVVEEKRGSEFDDKYTAILKLLADRTTKALEDHDAREAFYAEVAKDGPTWLADLPEPKREFRQILRARLQEMIENLPRFHDTDPLRANSIDAFAAMQQTIADLGTCLQQGVGFQEDNVF